MIGFGADICGDFGRATSREWLETDGLGGYASSTIAGANTRRYHGLLIAAARPPGRRMVLVSKLEETLAIREAEHDLSCNQYPGAIHPQGYRYLRAFRLDPFPTFLYEVGDAGAPVRLEKQVAMCRGTQAVIVRYRVLSAPGTVSLIVRPLLACREDHHLMQENPALNTAANLSGARDVVAMTLYDGCPTVHLQFAGAYFEGWGDWYRQFEYVQERARGLDYHEDLYSPGFFTRGMEPGETCYVIASVEPPAKLDPALMLERERRRRAFLRRGWEGASEDLATLVTAADAFLVSRKPGRDDRPAEGTIAGYHWFGEWGRDTMISLPGLTLVTRKFEAARTILRSYVSLLSEGMIPNLIPAPGETPAYNTVDATLWLFWAARKYLDYTGDREFVEGELRPAFQEIIAWHARGTRYGIKVDRDGLLQAGEAGTQLTWMDAKVGDWVVTPRHGKPVEVNALWHHALHFLEGLGARHDGPAASEVGEAFRRRFWNEATGYLNDVVDGESPEEASLRPNQIIAVSLPSPLLEPTQARRVVEAVQRELLTPYGLRTLSPRDPRYRGQYGGDVGSRDRAYHQGTVWPWLFGPFVSAYLRVAEDRAAAQETARQWVQPFFEHLREAGLGQISEIFTGDAPHDPAGCIAQAWSVAEVLRVMVEELGGMDMREASPVALRGIEEAKSRDERGQGPGARGQ